MRRRKRKQHPAHRLLCRRRAKLLRAVMPLLQPSAHDDVREAGMRSPGRLHRICAVEDDLVGCTERLDEHVVGAVQRRRLLRVVDAALERTPQPAAPTSESAPRSAPQIALLKRKIVTSWHVSSSLEQLFPDCLASSAGKVALFERSSARARHAARVFRGASAVPRSRELSASLPCSPTTRTSCKTHHELPEIRGDYKIP